MSGKLLARASALSLALFLAACGGDDSSSNLSGIDPGDTTGDQAGDGSDQDAVRNVGSLVLTATPVNMGTSEDAQSNIVVFVKDKNNGLMSEVPVSFSVDSNATLAASEVETDENGRAENILTTPADARNRSATVTATVGTVKRTIGIGITGTTLTLTGPNSMAVNSSQDFIATLEDSNGDGVVLEQLSINNENSGNSLGLASGVTTDSGEVRFSYNAATAGEDRITVTAFSGSSTLTATQVISISDNEFSLSGPGNGEIRINTPTNVTLNWNEGGTPITGQSVTFYATRGNIVSQNPRSTDANGNATIQVSSATAGPVTVTAQAVNPSSGQVIEARQDFEFVATTPASLTLQADRTQLKGNESSRLTAVVRDINGNLVKNRDVAFKITQDVSAGTLSQARATTNSLGRASVTFTAGPSPTGRDQSVVTATVGAISEDMELTVSGGASRLTIGTGNEILEPDPDHYAKDWSVFVTDVNGQPAEGANVELSVLPVSYGKGFYIQVDTDGDGEPDLWVPNRVATCPSEDINRNGFRDPGEPDVNGNGILDPTNDAVVTASGNQTNAEGAVHFQLVYPQSNCSWADVLVEARANVDGSEYKETARVTLSCSAEDLTNMDASPPSIQGGSKYGQTADCSTTD